MTRFALLALLSCLSVAMAADNTTEDLIKQIKVMATELDTDEAAKIKTFIETYAVPAELKSEVEISDEMIAMFMDSKKAALLKTLQALPSMSPTKVDDTTYRFTVDKEALGLHTDTITFSYSDVSKAFHLNNR